MADEQAPPPPEPPPSEPPPASPPPPLADAVKNAFGQYLAANDIRPGDGGTLDVDLDFLKQHAGPLIVHMLRAATQSLVPKDLSLSLGTAETPAAPAAPGATDTSETPPSEPPPVRINFDLGALLARLLQPPRP